MSNNLQDMILASIDVESTGIDPNTDKIITLGVHKTQGDKVLASEEFRCNPGIPIPPSSTEIHGLTDEMVKDCPTFSAFVDDFTELMSDVQGLVGYNLMGFDISIIQREILDAGAELDFPSLGMYIFDACVIFKEMERRDLSSAVMKYVGREHKDAHSALADAKATAEVLAGQLRQYPALRQMTPMELDKFCWRDKVDFAGTLRRNKDGEVVYGTHRNRGVRVVDDIGYAEWILRSNFPHDTRRKLRDIISQEQDRINSESLENTEKGIF